MKEVGKRRGKHTIVADKPQALRQRLDQLLIDKPRNSRRAENPVGGPHAVQRAGAALGDELLAVTRGGHDDVRYLTDGGP